jgi:hypothetical protein
MIGRKCTQLCPNHTAAILEANIHHHDLVVSMCSSRHRYCHLQLIGAHGTTPHPILSFACLQKVAIVDALANHSATKIPHSKHCTITKVQITAPASIWNLLRGQATNWFTKVIEWAIQTQMLGNKLVSQSAPIYKVKGTHRTSSHDDQDRLSVIHEATIWWHSWIPCAWVVSLIGKLPFNFIFKSWEQSKNPHCWYK